MALCVVFSSLYFDDAEFSRVVSTVSRNETI